MVGKKDPAKKKAPVLDAPNMIVSFLGIQSNLFFKVKLDFQGFFSEIDVTTSFYDQLRLLNLLYEDHSTCIIQN
jgi:hypothetical protein